MTPPYEAVLPAAAPVSRSFASLVLDFVSLTKPRLSSLVLFTTAGGMGLSGAALSWQAWALALLGTAGTVGAANAFNCFLERDSDRFMARTAERPLPARRMEPQSALVFAFALAAVSLPVLALGANLLTAALGLTALLAYVTVYTPLKARTHWAMVAGAVPGALPPLMGWTAATGRVELPGLALFGVLFFWQLPHFISIALFRKEEYRAAGLVSLPLARGDDTARLHAVLYLGGLLPMSVLPSLAGVTGPLYAAAAGALGLGFAWVGVRGWLKRGDAAWARRLFYASLLYLTGLFGALGLDRLLPL